MERCVGLVLWVMFLVARAPRTTVGPGISAGRVGVQACGRSQRSGPREATEEGQPPGTSALGAQQPRIPGGTSHSRGHAVGHLCPEEVRGQRVDHRPMRDAVKTGHVPCSRRHVRRKQVCGQSASRNRRQT